MTPDIPPPDFAPLRPDVDDEPGFPGLSGPAAAASPYRVLARKYRPQGFEDLIGQDAMVTTVRNAFAANRIPQAWMLTGVRGVGKTTTARILARGLNYEPEVGGPSGPTVDLPALGRHCRAIIESRHVDVLEVDAASHTGVENIRQITDSVRYGPAQARFKVYIIDEVHMLSPAAFNAFLKTLEEPPPHAKFVFATTEIRKVPVTILSRCQRFDLRRVDASLLVSHLARICGAEEVRAEDDALAAIARAAEGSVRDALSLLDQAVAHGAGTVTAAGIREMLGLADRAQIIDLFEAVMKGDVPATFALLRAGYEAGADPAQTLTDLAAFSHLVTRLKLVPEAAGDAALTEAERLRGADFAERLSIRALSRAWQILSRSAQEVGAASRPLAAAEMALVRLAYAADLPTPDEALRLLRGQDASGSEPARPGLARPGLGPMPSAEREPAASARSIQGGGSGGGSGGSASAALRRPDPEPTPGPAPFTLNRFEDVVALAAERREILLKAALERDVRLVRFDQGRIEIALEPAASRTLPNDLSRCLSEWTGSRWVVVLSQAAGETPLAERRRAESEGQRHDAASHPLVQAVLSRFPGATIVDVRERPSGEGEASDETVPPADDIDTDRDA